MNKKYTILHSKKSHLLTSYAIYNIYTAFICIHYNSLQNGEEVRIFISMLKKRCFNK